MRRFFSLLLACFQVFILSADIKVSDVKVFSGYPWKEVVIGYTITGAGETVQGIRLTATDKSANKSYTADIAKMVIYDGLSDGQHILRWNAAAEGVKFSSANVVFTVSVVAMGVQLWANGPYWAEYNVGATKPEEYGYYFWWGDTIGYKRNASNNGWVSVANGASFSFESGSCSTYGKDTATLKSQGYIDASGNLVAKYDAATKYLGAPWRIPTNAEWNTLINNCTTTWTTRNGVYGRLVTGKGAYASKSIFLPAVGRDNGSFLGAGSLGCYYSSTPHSTYSTLMWYLSFDSSDFSRYNGTRNLGLTVRPLREFVQ